MKRQEFLNVRCSTSLPFQGHSGKNPTYKVLHDRLYDKGRFRKYIIALQTLVDYSNPCGKELRMVGSSYWNKH